MCSHTLVRILTIVWSEQVRYLVQMGANPNVVSVEDRRTPLFWAVHHSAFDAAYFLCHHGADATVVDVLGGVRLSGMAMAVAFSFAF